MGIKEADISPPFGITVTKTVTESTKNDSFLLFNLIVPLKRMNEIKLKTKKATLWYMLRNVKIQANC